MDVNDIRLLIRKSLKTKIVEESHQLVKPPRNFEEFRRQFALELSKTDAKRHLVDEAYDCEYKSGPLFDAMWNAWRDLLPEIRGLREIPTIEAQREWTTLKETYIREVVNSDLT